MNFYINYYSKIRTKLNMSQEDLQRELNYNAGRIVTKTFANSADYDAVVNNRVGFNAFKHLMYNLNTLNRGLISYTRNSYTNEIYVPYFTIASDYHTFEIPKHSGGMRTITAPNDNMKEMQYVVLKAFQKAKLLPHNAAHGFVKNRNCKTALQVHQKAHARWFLKLDIKDFFNSIDADALKVELSKNLVYVNNTNAHMRETIIQVCTADGHLTQGAPTSPLLSNLFMVDFDYNLTKYCKEQGLTYTRYADDILITSPYDFNTTPVKIRVMSLLTALGLSLNTDKIRYGNFNGRNWNLGLMFNNKYEITVGHKYKKLIKNMLHNYDTKPEYRTLENRYKIQGMIAYARYIEPEYFKDYPVNLDA